MVESDTKENKSGKEIKRAGFKGLHIIILKFLYITCSIYKNKKPKYCWKN